MELDQRLQDLLLKKREASESIEQLLREAEELFQAVDEVAKLPERQGFADRGRFDLYLDVKHGLGERFDDTKVRAYVEELLGGLQRTQFRAGWHEFEPVRRRVIEDIKVLADGPDYESLGIAEDLQLIEQLLKRLVQHYGR